MSNVLYSVIDRIKQNNQYDKSWLTVNGSSVMLKVDWWWFIFLHSQCPLILNYFYFLILSPPPYLYQKCLDYLCSKPTEGSTWLHVQRKLVVTSMRLYLLKELWNLCFCDHLYAVICDLVMDKQLERRAIMKVCIQLETSTTETLGTLWYAHCEAAMQTVM